LIVHPVLINDQIKFPLFKSQTNHNLQSANKLISIHTENEAIDFRRLRLISRMFSRQNDGGLWLSSVNPIFGFVLIHAESVGAIWVDKNFNRDIWLVVWSVIRKYTSVWLNFRSHGSGKARWSPHKSSTMTALNSSDPDFDFYVSIINDEAYWLSLAVAGFILALVIITANSALLFTTYKDPRKSLRSAPCLLIANLSASDLLLGLFNVFLVAVRDVYRYKQVHMPSAGVFRAIMYTVFTTTLFVSSNSIIAMSITCYVAINKPMDYKNIITRRRIKIYIAVLWVISIASCILPVMSVSEKTYTMIYLHTHASLPAILLTVIYVKVFRALARRTRELQACDYNSIASNALQRERNMAFVIIIILSLYYISYVPQYITLHLLYFCQSCEESLTFHKIDVALSRFLYINSAINPFVYAWRVPKYRQAFTDCWKLCRCRPIVSRRHGSFSLSSQRQVSRERRGTFLESRSRTQSEPSDLTSVL